MDTGVAMFPTHDAIGPGELAALVEERGHGSLWFPEHTHIPASRDSPFPGGGEMPRRYAHTYDLFVAMTAAAVATRRLRVGERHLPDHRARPDHHRQGGREHRPPLRRARRVRRRRGLEPRGDGQPRHRLRAAASALMRERVEAMKAIWTQEEASYHGEHVDFERIWSFPKPVQLPHPPVVIGGNGEKVIDRVLRYGDAWAPQHRHGNAVERIAELRGAPRGRPRPHPGRLRRARRRRVLAEYSRPASTASCTGCRGQRGPVERRSSASRTRPRAARR